MSLRERDINRQRSSTHHATSKSKTNHCHRMFVLERSAPFSLMREPLTTTLSDRESHRFVKRRKMFSVHIDNESNYKQGDDQYTRSRGSSSGSSSNNNSSSKTSNIMSTSKENSRETSINNDNISQRNSHTSNNSSNRIQHRRTRAQQLFTLQRRMAIDKLGNECLYEIFKHCADPETLTAISHVCRRWRFITTDSWLWRTMDHDWIQFLESVFFFKHMPNHYAFDHLRHTRRMRITAREDQLYNPIPMCIPEVYPFVQLARVDLVRMHLVDIIDVVKWLVHIQELRCIDIMTHGMAQSNVLSAFTSLHRLRVLHLHFYTPCNHGNYAFLISRNRARPVLPSTLRDVQITNLYDTEEQLLNDLRPHHWMRIEAALMIKYSPLQSLVNLDTLVLHSCSAYTARVWRECLTPCAHNLRYLSLGGLRSQSHNAALLTPNDGNSPVNDPASLWTTDEEAPVRDIWNAIHDFFINLVHLEYLHLEDFTMDSNILDSLRFLEQSRGQTIHLSSATFQGNACDIIDLEDMIDRHVAFCDITIR